MPNHSAENGPESSVLNGIGDCQLLDRCAICFTRERVDRVRFLIRNNYESVTTHLV